jgi:positive regulator of sigma E activity
MDLKLLEKEVLADLSRTELLLAGELAYLSGTFFLFAALAMALVFPLVPAIIVLAALSLAIGAYSIFRGHSFHREFHRRRAGKK